MLRKLSRAFFLSLGRSSHLASWISRPRAQGSRGFVNRFIGGTSIQEALATAAQLDRRTFSHTLNHLGEHVTSPVAAQRATLDYLNTVDRLAAAGLESVLSVKLSQLGLELDRDLCKENLHKIVVAAGDHDGFVRIDMEGSQTVDDTLTVFETIWGEHHRNVGVALQAYLHRTGDDLKRLLRLGASIRLCKGAYDEPQGIAYRKKRDVDAAFVRLMRTLLVEGRVPAIATHDRSMIDATCTFAEARELDRREFEFELLYGVRRDLQQELRARGYCVRVYVPFGSDWYEYFMRRLAERPENVLSVVRSLAGERLRAR